VKTEDEHPPAYAIVARPPTGKLWLLLPAPALFYPLAVKAPYESGKLLHPASGPGDAMAWLAIAVSAALVYGVSAVGIAVAYRLARDERPRPRNSWQVALRTWRWLLLPRSASSSTER